MLFHDKTITFWSRKNNLDFLTSEIYCNTRKIMCKTFKVSKRFEQF